MPAYYNEIDPFAAAWLRNLIAAGHIAPGDVDERSIVDVNPEDLRGYEQCHFFAGIGVWSYALRRAGVPDTERVWTGSCPCQPFSAAGKGGGFDDERHLWPAWFHLIDSVRPRRVLGEQVASKDGLGWLDLVQSDMEATNYAFGAVDLCAAGVGAPHIRQRLWFMADANTTERRADATGRNERDGAHTGRPQGASDAQGCGGLGELAESETERRPGWTGLATGQRATEQRPRVDHLSRLVADADGGDQGDCDIQRSGQYGQRPQDGVPVRSADQGIGHNRGPELERPGPTNGLWRNADWLRCRDDRWRPVEPGTFPLAHGAPARVGRLRAYGNAINAQAAEEFIRAAYALA